MFGLKSASEVFQKKNKAVFEGIDGIHIVADDIIIAASSVEEHDHILQQVLDRAMKCNIKFNFDKFQLRISAVNYLGSVISHQGMKPDPAMVKAISSMSTPCDKQAVRQLLGMINFLAPHILNMANITAPLCDFVKSDVYFQWGSAWKQVKDILSTDPILQFFGPAVKSTIQADASQHGLGACLMQKGKPVAYVHAVYHLRNAITVRLKRSSLQLIVFVCKFHQFIYGSHTDVQTD